MICPDCERLIKGRRYRKGKCKCGYVMKFYDYLRETCPYDIICNDGDDCIDEDWGNCGSYSRIGKLLNGVQNVGRDYENI